MIKKKSARNSSSSDDAYAFYVYSIILGRSVVMARTRESLRTDGDFTIKRSLKRTYKKGNRTLSHGGSSEQRLVPVAAPGHKVNLRQLPISKNLFQVRLPPSVVLCLLLQWSMDSAFMHLMLPPLLLFTNLSNRPLGVKDGQSLVFFFFFFYGQERTHKLSSMSK